MLSVAYLEIDLFAIIILVLIFANMRRGNKALLPDQRLYISMLLFIVAILVFDMGMWLIDKRVFQYARAANTAISFIYYIINPIPIFFWALYADYKVFGSIERIKKIVIPFSFPFIIITVLSAFSCFSNILFFVDDNNIYHRGKWFILTIVLEYIYVAYCEFIIIKNRKRIEKRNFWPLLFFAIPPSIGGIFQVVFYGVNLIWISATLSMLMIFISIQNDLLLTDHLTGLYNRRQLDSYLNTHLNYNRENSYIAGIMLDVDNFKFINDNNGHLIGDQALEYTADILRKSLKKDGFIARYGGDEFIILLDVNNPDEIFSTIDKIKENTAAININNSLPYKINLSIGYDVFDKSSKITAEEFLKSIDRKMYLNKHGESLI